LVVQNGRQSGAHRALTAPLTLIGRAADCDVRLNVEEVEDHHCLLFHGPTGLVLRDLQSSGGTYVNGQAVPTCILHEGDLLSIGPFSFQIKLYVLAAESEPEAVRREKEALRIQAAAVAAQQAALTEEEIRLRRQQTALEQQEQQLAAHLEEKRQRLLALRDEARQAHAALQDERAKYENRVAEVMQGLEQSRHEVATEHQQNQAERQRLLALRRRLKQRWHRQWAGERTAMQRREADLAARQRTLEKERERLQQDKAAAMQSQMRANGEIEVSRRQLQEEWERLNKERGELEEVASVLEQRKAVVEEAEQKLAEEQRHWQEVRLQRTQEVEGLESRVRNQRRKILDQEQAAVRLEALMRGVKEIPALSSESPIPSEPAAASTVPPTVASPDELGQREWRLRTAEADLQSRTVALEALAGELTDQRLQLAEEFTWLAQVEQRWRQDRDALAAELEALGARLLERERTLQSGEQALEAAQRTLRQRSEEVARTQRNLEAWKGRLAAGAAAWQGERERLLVELRAREEAVEQRLASLEQLRQRWDERRGRQVDRLRSRRAACEEVRRECAALRDEWSRREAALVQEQRGLAERALALEQYRQECIGKASNPAAAEKRLENLRRHWAALSATAQRALSGERQRLDRDTGRLEERLRQLHEQEQEIAVAEAELSRRQAAWEQQQAIAEADQGKLRQELHSFRNQRHLYEQQLQELRDEVERLARLLLEDNNSPVVPTVQAA
jgi:pSer/pThr/pTyr-binding forkhead associated (FHA) protein